MAMMISKFNNLIRSRLLWGAFLVVIVLSFVVWGMPSCTGDEARSRQAEGRLDGRDVTAEELRPAFDMARITLQGRRQMLGEDYARALRREAWLRYARLQKVREWKLEVSEDELRNYLAENFTDPATGQFDRVGYDRVCAQIAEPFNYSLAAVEHFFAEELALRKLDLLVASQVQLADSEVEQSIHSFMDSVLADYVRIPTDDIAASVEVSEDDARAAFDADPAAFTLPETRTVSYVVIPDPDPESGEVAVDPEEVEAVYYDSGSRFEIVSTNEEGVVSSDLRPLDEVRPEIEAELRASAVRDLSEEAADDFYGDLLHSVDGVMPVFAELAAARGLECVDVPSFGAGDDPVPAIGPGLVAETFRLEPGPYDSIGGPLRVENGWVVLKLTGVEKARVPEFSEVVPAATEAARAKAVADAVAARVAAFREAALADGFEAAAGAQGFAVAAAEPFTAMNAAMSDNADVRALASVAAAVNPGEITEAAPVDGAVLVARVKGIVPAAPEEYESDRPNIAQALRQRRASEWVARFNESLLADFEDYHPIRAAGDYEEDGEEEAGEAGDGEDAAE